MLIAIVAARRAVLAAHTPGGTRTQAASARTWRQRRGAMRGPSRSSADEPTNPAPDSTAADAPTARGSMSAPSSAAGSASRHTAPRSLTIW